jgi:hypothetical protein
MKAFISIHHPFPMRSLPAISLVLLLSLSLPVSCSWRQTQWADPLSPLEVSPSPVPSDWTAFENYGHPVKVTPVAIEMVPAKRILLPENQSEAFLKPLSDGGCLSVTTVQSDDKDAGGNPLQILRVIRFKADGSTGWDHRYDSEPFQGFPAAMCLFPDDGFALSLRIATDAASGAYGDQLWRFSPEGNLLRRTTGEQVRAGELDHIFAAGDGSVLATGTVEMSAGAVGTSEGTAETSPASQESVSGGGIGIGLLRLDGSNLPLEADAFGSTGSEMLMDASYAAGTGIILSWTRPYVGMNDGSALQNICGIACFDENLTMKWKTEMPDGAILYEVQALPGGEGILAFGSLPATGSESSSEAGQEANPSSMRSALFYFDGKGVRQWTYAAEGEKAWIRTATRLSDGRFLIGIYQSGPEGEEATTLVLWDSGNKKDAASGGKGSILDTIPGIVTQLASTGDGGFTIILRQTLSAIPQPPYVSSIWTDTEAIAAHYDRNMKLLWRRTVDQYRHVLRLDLVVPTADDRLLIG